MITGKSTITHVMLHESDKDKKFKAAKKVHQDYVIKLAKRNDVLIYTLEWNYVFKEWQKGAAVSVEKINDTECLVTKRDDNLTNNLASLLPMKVLTAKSKIPAPVAL